MAGVPKVWNYYPVYLRESESVHVFRRALKTHLFHTQLLSLVFVFVSLERCVLCRALCMCFKLFFLIYSIFRRITQVLENFSIHISSHSLSRLPRFSFKLSWNFMIYRVWFIVVVSILNESGTFFFSSQVQENQHTTLLKLWRACQNQSLYYIPYAVPFTAT